MTDTPVPEHDNLTAALAAVQAELPQVAKGEKADVPTKNGPGYSYRYASLADLSQAVLPLLGRHGLAWVCLPTYGDDGRFVLRWQLRHAGGEVLEGSWLLPTQGGPQAQGSAITYARRYCLLAVTGVAPDDDDDGAAAQAASSQQGQQPRRQPSQMEGGPPVCASCGGSLVGARVVRRDEGLVHRDGCGGDEADPNGTTAELTAIDPDELPTVPAELYPVAGPALARLHRATDGREPYARHYRELRDALDGDPRDGAVWADAPDERGAVLQAAVGDLLTSLAEAEG